MICYIKEYIQQYIPAEAYGVSCIRRHSLLNECAVMLLRWSVATACLHVECLSHGQEQISPYLFIY